MMEIWAGAVYGGIDYSWRFEVSTYGQIRNAKNKHLYSPSLSSSGYLQVCVSISGKQLNVRVHRCVAETFIGNADEFEIVNHIDGNKQNNCVDNLEWVNRRENYRHAVANELINPDISYNFGQSSHVGLYRGSQNGMAKLDENDVKYIRENYIHKGQGRCNRKDLAFMFGVSPGLISQIIDYKIWTHV